MFKFLIKGVLRDKSRSLFPILIIAAGVMITVVLYAWIQGNMQMMIYENARFETGHVKIVTKAYEKLIDEKPIDLGILAVDKVMQDLKKEFPDEKWVMRIYFGGLLDLPNEKGESISQGEVAGFAVDLFSNETEKKLLNLNEALMSGKLPTKSGEILISDDVAKKMKAQVNDKITMITSTVLGSMAMQNFKIAGTIKFGVQALDKGAVIIDIKDAQKLLDMNNGCSEILGFMKNFVYDEKGAVTISNAFNKKIFKKNDEFSLEMIPLSEQGFFKNLLNSMKSILGTIIFIFIFLMSLVLWNSGLISGIRRYGEIGIRLAMGESKNHVYFSMILESVVIGFIASFIGTLLGLLISLFLQEKGISISSIMQNISIIMNSKIKALITSECFYIGFIPGFFSTITGSMMAGVGIYKRRTAQIIKELEA